MPPRHLLALAFLACAPTSPASDASSTSETTSEPPPCGSGQPLFRSS
jgi:hypothetical protein